MAQLVLAGQGQAFGQGVLQPGELQGEQDPGQVRPDMLGGGGTGGRRHGASSSGSSSTVMVPAGSPPRIRVRVVVPPLAVVVLLMAGLVARVVAYSAGSRANRAVVVVPVGSNGISRSVACLSMVSILVTEITSRSRAVPQAALTGAGPYRRTRPRRRYTVRILVQGRGASRIR